MIDVYNIKTIDEENWNSAEGISDEIRKDHTNTMLAPRDYDVKCRFPHRIGVFHGVHVWWCSAHFQPLFHCDADRKKIIARSFAQAVIDNDRTDKYEYGEKNNKREEPGTGQRWASPTEMAKTFLKNI